MSLRARLVAALALLLTVGLFAFGAGTYGTYARSQQQRLDTQIRASAGFVSRQLTENAGLSYGPGPGPTGIGPQGPAIVLPPGTYAQLRDADGDVVTSIQASSSTRTPDLPTTLPATHSPFTVGSSKGSGRWRVLLSAIREAPGYTAVVAVPTTEVDNSLHRLVLTELVAGLALLAVLSAGSWLVLRRGLRPLERMAEAARSINAGDLSHRVSPSDSRGEVGQLGLALNTMLDEIEEAFRDREATEQQLRQFLADASHELRTPLTSIRGFAELFRLGTDSEHVDLAVIMRRIEEESTRMKTLVDDLLLLARLDQRRVAERTPVDLAVLAADACSDAVASDRTRTVTLDAPDPVVVDGDRDHLRQAITNLTANAVRHTPSGTGIEVGAGLVDGQAIVTVRDHGQGLDDEALVHAFDRFWQADQARVGTGAGLGLSIVAAIAREHGGSASAANHPGGGALFTLRLPVSA